MPQSPMTTADPTVTTANCSHVPGMSGTTAAWSAINRSASDSPNDSHDWNRATSERARYAQIAVASSGRSRRRQSRDDHNSSGSTTRVFSSAERHESVAGPAARTSKPRRERMPAWSTAFVWLGIDLLHSVLQQDDARLV